MRPTGLLHAHAGPRELGVLRITVFALWLPHLLTTPLSNIALLPAELVEPHGLLRLAPVTHLTSSPWALTALTIAAAAGCLLGLVGSPAHRVVGAITLALLLVHEGLTRALAGYVIHGRITLLFLTAVVVIAPSADALALRSPRGTTDDGRHAWGLIGASVVVALTYSLVGARRIVRGGVEIFTDRSLELWLVARSQQPSALGFDLGLDMVNLPGVLTLLPLLFLATSIFELLSPLALRWDRFRWPWLVAILGFHIVVTLAMSLDFRIQIVLVLVLFGVIPWLTSRRRRPDPRQQPDLGAVVP